MCQNPQNAEQFVGVAMAHGLADEFTHIFARAEDRATPGAAGAGQLDGSVDRTDS
jgi:hypothetical protein